MKILLLTEFFPQSTSKPILTGGVEARTYYLFQWLSRRHRVTVWRRTSRYQFNASFRIALERCLYNVKTIVYALSTRDRFDIVEGTNALTYPLAYLLARRTGAKAIAWIPDLFGKQAIRNIGFLNGIFIHFFEWLTFQLRWDGVITLSNATREKLPLLHPSTLIQTIHGGVQRPTNRSYKILKYRDPTILTIARLVSYKRVDLVLLAAHIVQQKVPKLRLIVVGDGPEKQRLARLSRQLGIDGCVTWKSRITEEDKWLLLARSHLHVLPSEFEGMGLVTLEALAAGTPVVTCDIPINKEVLQGEQGGLLFTKGDYVELAHGITRLLSDCTLYERKSREAKELVKQYQWDTVNFQTERFYKLVSKLTPGHCEESSTRQSTFSIRSPRLSEEPRDDF